MTTDTDNGLDAVIENRHLNVALLVGLFPSGSALAKHMGVHWTLISNVTKKDESGRYRRTLGEKVARKIERNLGVDVGWLDRPQFPDSLPKSVIEAIQFADRHANYRRNSPPSNLVPVAESKGEPSEEYSTIQTALLDTTKRLLEKKLLSDVDCLAVLQSWQPLIAQMKTKSS